MNERVDLISEAWLGIGKGMGGTKGKCELAAGRYLALF